MAEKVCFGQSNLETCVALEPVDISADEIRAQSKETATSVKGYNALACAKKAEELDGLNIMACNANRHCLLYHSDMDDKMLQKIIGIYSDVIPVDIWYSSSLDIRPTFDYGTLFFLTPDKKLLTYDGEVIQYIGEGEHVLSNRERHVFKTSEGILSYINKNLLPKSAAAENKSEGTEEGEQAPTLISFEDELLNRDPFVTPAQSQILSSNDEIVAHLNSWLAGQHSDLVSSCIQENSFYYSPTTTSVNHRSIYAAYSDHSIILSANSLPELLDHTRLFDSTILHECLHWDFFDRYAVWDEPAEIMIEATELAKTGLVASGIRKKRADDMLERYQNILIEDWPVIGNELRAYTCETDNDEDHIKKIFEYLAWRYPSDTALYILDWMANLMETDTDLTAEQYATARSYIETFKIYIRGYKTFEPVKFPATPFEMQASVWWFNQFFSFPNDDLRKALQGALKYYYLSTR